jgi:hypothetical protein
MTTESLISKAEAQKRWSAAKAVITRREAIRGLVAASVGAMMPPSIGDASQPVHRASDFALVLERILQAVASGQATGVAVAVAQRPRGGSRAPCQFQLCSISSNDFPFVSGNRTLR